MTKADNEVREALDVAHEALRDYGNEEASATLRAHIEGLEAEVKRLRGAVGRPVESIIGDAADKVVALIAVEALLDEAMGLLENAEEWNGEKWNNDYADLRRRYEEMK